MLIFKAKIYTIPLALNSSSSIFVLLVTNDDKPHHFTQYKENNENRQLLKSRPTLADLRVHAVRLGQIKLN